MLLFFCCFRRQEIFFLVFQFAAVFTSTRDAIGVCALGVLCLCEKVHVSGGGSDQLYESMTTTGVC